MSLHDAADRLAAALEVAAGSLSIDVTPPKIAGDLPDEQHAWAVAVARGAHQSAGKWAFPARRRPLGALNLAPPNAAGRLELARHFAVWPAPPVATAGCAVIAAHSTFTSTARELAPVECPAELAPGHVSPDLDALAAAGELRAALVLATLDLADTASRHFVDVLRHFLPVLAAARGTDTAGEDHTEDDEP